jgi:hypothetical protein
MLFVLNYVRSRNQYQLLQNKRLAWEKDLLWFCQENIKQKI